MEENKKNSKLPIAVIAGVLVIALAGGVMKTVAASERKNALNTMTEMVDTKVQEIDSFIGDAKKTLTLYADAPEIKKMLNDPENEKAAVEAQEFTERYSESINELEGIYTSDLSTCVLVHSDSKIVGMITRPDPDSAEELVQLMLDSEDGIYSNGILLSPASGTQIVSMYKSISGDDDNCIGFAGLGVKAGSVLNNDNPSIKGVESASYSLIRVDHNMYIFNADPEADSNEVTNNSILSLCSELSGTDAPAKGTIDYKDETGSYTAAYSFMPEYGMLLMLEGKTD